MGTNIMSDLSSRSGDRDGAFSPRRYMSSTDNQSLRTFSETDLPRNKRQQIDQIQRIAGFSIGLTGIFAEQVLSHPCIVLRRQCQVHHDGTYYHLTPFTLFSVLLNLQKHQGMQTLWKGIGGVFLVKGIFMVTETAVSEATNFPREITRHSTVKKCGEHLLLKILSYTLTTPFYAASLKETIQSDIASEKPGVLDVVREGVTRLAGWGMPHSSRLLPIYRLILPTVLYRSCHYIICSIAQYTVLSASHLEQQELRPLNPEEPEPQQTVYDVYFPEMLATFTGGLLADLTLFPIETVLHRLYVQGTRIIIDNTDNGLDVIPINTRYPGFVECFQQIISEEGIPGLYRGFGALILQYAVHAIILKMAKYLFERLGEELQPSRSRPPSASPAAVKLEYSGPRMP